MTKQNNKNSLDKRIVVAWIVLIILIITVISLTYLKFWGPNVNIKEQPINSMKENNNVENDSKDKSLSSLAANFNSSFIVNDYKKENVEISATLSKDDFVVNQTDNSKSYNKKFVCKYNGGILTSDISLEDASYFDIVYRIIIYANQVIASPNVSVDNIISGVLNGTDTYSGLSKEVTGNNVTYSIDLLGIVGDQKGCGYMPTAHIESNLGDIASIVIMPGDPKRASYIAKNYLNDVVKVNDVRGITAYTGLYKNKKVTVFPSGMGIPSMGIYSYELFKFYNVDTIIRIGTMGSYVDSLDVGDLVLTNRSYSDSSFALVQSNYDKNYLDANIEINKIIEDTAKKNNIILKNGDIYTSDVFYADTNYEALRDKYNVVGVEMETFGLLQEARITGKKATAIFTISNSFVNNRELSSSEREKNLDKMITLALETSLNL